MKKVSLLCIAVFSCAAVPFGLDKMNRAAVSEEVHPSRRHLRTAMRYMDAGERSLQYRESVGYLRRHAREVSSEVSHFLLESRGSFRKWQIVYLLGEVGDESTLALLRELLDRPVPEPLVDDSSEHFIDLHHAEEVTSRAQAVMSISRIAWVRPYLRDQVVASLVEVAREVPSATSSAIYELRKLLGDDVDDLREQLPTEHWWELERFIPPPEWQGKLAEKIQERDRAEREREIGRRSCSFD